MSGIYYDDRPVGLQELALRNPLILECIFKFCSAKDLSQYRLVNRLWHYVSFPFWKELVCPVTLYEHARDAVFENNKHITLSAFIEMCETAKRRCQTINGLQITDLLHKFKLMFFRDLSSGPGNRPIKRFWTDCGPWISELQIFGARLNNFSAYKNVLLCKYTPNVKNFKFSCQFDGVIGQDVDDSSCVAVVEAHKNLTSLTFLYCTPKVGWMELLSHFPNMTHFELSSPYRLANWENQLVKMMSCIKTLRMNNKTSLPLKSLTINVVGVDQNPARSSSFRISDLLQNAEIPLESLSIDAYFFRGEANKSQLTTLLRLYQFLLKKLKIRDSLCEPPLIFPSLVMTSLRELTLTGKSFMRMSMLKFTPNLTLLHIINPWRSRAMDKYMLKGFIGSTERLKLPRLRNFRYDFDCTPCGMFCLVCWLPNVEVLEMPLTNETFRIACKHWGKIRHLVVQKDDLDDDGICGGMTNDKVAVPAFTLIQHKLDMPPHPNITDLKDLRSFVMENHRYNHSQELEAIISPNDILPTKLTEKSMQHGFLKLSRLQKLSITVQQNAISAKLLERIKNKVQEVNVVQMNHPYRHRL